MHELQNSCCFTSIVHIFPRNLSCGPSYWKHIGKEIWGSVVQPGRADTSPSHHAQLSSKPKDSSGRLSYGTPSCLLRKRTGLAQSWGTTFKGARCLQAWDMWSLCLMIFTGRLQRLPALELCADRAAVKGLVQENLL